MKFIFLGNRGNKSIGKKVATFLLVIVTLFSLSLIPTKSVRAQVGVVSAPALEALTAQKSGWDRFMENFKNLWQKAGSYAYQRALSTALNKIAYDAANYLGSGGKGQKPLFVTEGWDTYLLKIGDESAGQFLESFVNQWAVNNNKVNNEHNLDSCNTDFGSCMNSCSHLGASVDSELQMDPFALNNTDDCEAACQKSLTGCTSGAVKTGSSGMTPSFNVCQPSSLSAKVRIGLGLAEQSRPNGPNCSASLIVQNWGGDLTKKYAAIQSGSYLENYKNVFNPTSNDLGIYILARTDLSSKAILDTKNTENSLIANKGFLSQVDLAGNLIGTPGAAEKNLDAAKQGQQTSLGKVTGDILVDTANVFLNQLAISAFNNLINNLGKKAASPNNAPSGNNYFTDPNVVYGEVALNKVTSKLLETKFSERADYNILSDLSVCVDKNNPGPDNCVLDTQFMQAISENKTVGEALKGGLLHGDWQLTNVYSENNYSTRNLSILRKYRIIPVGWEVAVEKAYASSTNIRKATLSDLVSCFSPNDNYYLFSSSFNTRDTSWCAGLIDPTWVLKAPLNYCRKQGFGAQFLSTPQIIPGMKNQLGVADTLNTLSVARVEDYCADGQTCIKETNQGSCDKYGYCTEEKKIWSFGTDSCDPIYNTCQSFKNTDSGQAVNYLENTLDYASCTADSAGCHQYSLFGLYASTTDKVAWSSAWSLYLNKKLGTCNSKDEGCTELIRVRSAKSGYTGTNLIMNSDFRDDAFNASSTTNYLNNWPIVSTAGNKKATIVDASLEPGGYSGKALKLTANGQIGVASSNSGSLVPANLQIIAGQAYTLSADVYLEEGDNVTLSIGTPAEKISSELTDKKAWRRVSVTRFPSDTYNETIFSFTGNGSKVTFYLKNLKLEMSSWDTGYSSYAANKIYEKIIPPYLEASCYVNGSGATKDYSLKSDAPIICANYARKCNKEEVGCELYKDTRDGFSVPAQATDKDICPAECVGYDVYISKDSYFNPAQAENLIPSTAKACNANSAGCSEFTNLDELAKGGEAKEYYTYLKQCIKPSPTDCGDFYAWEGTESGYQLKSYSLKKNGAEPAVTADDSALCNAAIYNSPVGTARYNPDCREFYNVAGQSFYHLISQTVTCSNDCHAYRLTAKNIDNSLTAAQCVGTDRNWDSDLSKCYVCQSGGTWDLKQAACIYQAIPGEGLTCSAAEAGCREYNGNGGNNIQLTTYNNFENDLAGWYSNCNSGVAISPISNSKNGHSLQYNNQASGCGAIGDTPPTATSRVIEQILADNNVAAQLKVSGLVKTGSAYILKFLARSTEDANIQVYFLNKDTKESASFTIGTSAIKVKGGNEWNLYQASLENLDHPVGANELLIITADKSLFIDDFVLSEVTDRYYLIKNSSQIPPVCYYDELDNYQGADYNLGCASYIDRSGATNYFHQFSHLCSNSAVGCEQMIDTKNYNAPGTGIWNDTNKNNTCDSDEPDCVKVSGDSALYAVYDASKQCNVADQGCSRLGQAQGQGNNAVWTDVYKKNNPNNYFDTLCAQEDLGCEEWQTGSNSLSYFKNPGFNACTYRNSQDPSVIGKNWYKVPAKRCDVNNNKIIDGDEKNGAICTDGGCGGKACLLDNNDYFCSVSYLKTMGQGGGGNQVATPDQSAGLCEAAAAGCTEYIDPVSQFSSNLVYNPNFQTVNGSQEGWGTTSPLWTNNNPVNVNQQVVTITPNKLYILAVQSPEKVNTSTVTLDFSDYVKPLITDYAAGTSTNNTFGTSTKQIILPIYNDPLKPIMVIFHSMSNTKARLTGGVSNKTIILREAVTGYQLSENIDKGSCNSVANFDNGCVLFNERSINAGKGLSTLNLNALATADGQAVLPCAASSTLSCTANTLIKVKPDRTCGKWLACTSYAQDPTTGKPGVCYTVSECDRLDDKGECANFTSVPTNDVRLFDLGRDRNATGYSVIDKYYLSNMKEVGLNSEAHYDFEEAVPALSCRRDVNFNGGPTPCTFDSNNIAKFTIVREPSNQGADYPAHGRGYLKVPAAYQISPLSAGNFITLETTASSSAYYLNLLVNTRNSGLGAKIMITGTANGSSAPAPLVDAIIKDPTGTSSKMIFYTSANNGWERKVFKFNLAKINNGKTTDINIYLTSDFEPKAGEKPSGNNYVYFDDINIEPVLEIGKDQYAARECRLYPSNDSLACVNKDNNNIQEGLEGYCLEHDLANPGVCLLWYPVDKISATNNKPSLGYLGKTPLNYCTGVNGNFTLVEKRSAMKIFDSNMHDSCGVCNNDGCGQNGTWCFFPQGTATSTMESVPICGKAGDRAFNFGSYSGNTIGTSWDDFHKSWTFYDSFSCGPNTATGSPDYFLMVQRYRDCAKDDNNTTGTNHFDYCVACVPVLGIISNIAIISPLLSTQQEAIKCETHGNILELPQNAGWYKYNGLQCSPAGDCSSINEAKNADPSVRVYNFDSPPAQGGEEYLKQISGNDQEKAFRLVCNQFAQVVESNGDNKAWASRVSIMTEFAAATPNFFTDNVDYTFGSFSAPAGIPYGGSVYKLNRYGRNREDVPFGAASWPADLDILSSPPITLRDQYSKKNNETIFAGRPYGCIQDNGAGNGVADGCNLIGSCSLDANAFCLVDGRNATATSSDNNYVRRETCAANGLGTCVPLWSDSLFSNELSLSGKRPTWLSANKFPTQSSPDSENILSTLFLKAYNSFAISSTGGSYFSTSSYDRLNKIYYKTCPNSTRPADSYKIGKTIQATSSFCSILPVVSNAKFFIGDTKTTASSTVPYHYEVKKGIYRLEFNTSVDPEQQPLRSIMIDWGDGKYQVVTDQDQRPNESNKHVFYHYYTQSYSSAVIQIRAHDNWGLYGDLHL